MTEGFTVAQIAEWVSGRIANAQALGDRLGAVRVSRPAVLADSQVNEVAFFFSRAYQADLLKAQPSILITGEAFIHPLEASGLPLWKSAVVIACADPYYAMAVLSEKFASKASSVAHSSRPKPGIHPSAVVAKSAEIAPDASIGPLCVVEENARIGHGSVLYASCYVGPDAIIGDDCVVFPGVKLYEQTQLGNRVRIHAGCVLGADGFGYAPKMEGGRIVSHQKIYHLGRVVIGDDVEIGANTCIDRGTFGDTRIERGVKIDDLVMIGHNCHVDEGAIICGNVGLCGSSSVGKFAYIGGASGLNNQVHVGDGAKVGGMSLVMRDVAPGETVVGSPQRPYREHFRIQALLNRMLEESRVRRKTGGKNES